MTDYEEARDFYCKWLSLDLDQIDNEIDGYFIKCLQAYAEQKAIGFGMWLDGGNAETAYESDEISYPEWYKQFTQKTRIIEPKPNNMV